MRIRLLIAAMAIALVGVVATPGGRPGQAQR